MNIEQAKTEIKRTVSIYLMKDAYGNYRLERQHQRPIFMLGAPGIGKTAVAAQIAEEMHLPLVSYSMTHHTRQSAIGLPFIQHRSYDGKEFDVSVYTLSEIISSVYEAMKKSGQREGILFLDEINCVSETLAPAMLQFLQYKTFGNHELPEGWVIVTAGNPQIYNRNARTFDIATLDRLKVLTVEPDYSAWKKYAGNAHMHAAILSFLDVHRNYFFHISSKVDGKSYVTPRGWEDLSKVMHLYEEMNYPIDDVLVGQYLHDEKIADAFVSYFMLYGKYQEDYHIADILSGNAAVSVRERMRKAGFDERISVTNLLLDAVGNQIQEEQVVELALRRLHDPLKELKNSENPAASLNQLEDTLKHEAVQSEQSRMEKMVTRYMLSFLKKNAGVCNFEVIAGNYEAAVGEMKKKTDEIEAQLAGMFAFLKENASEQEILIAVTRLTTDQNDARFISMHGCDDYYQYNEMLNMQKRSMKIRKDIDDLQS